MTEPICKKCNQGLYEVLRKGYCDMCHETGYESHTADFEKPYPDPYEFPKDDETKRETGLDRFSPVFTGFSWFVVDKMGGWYKTDTHEKAALKAADLNYQWDAMI